MLARAFSKTADAVIVGGGVIGLSIARELALRGMNDVVVLERGESFGAEASSAAGGILAPQIEANQQDGFFEVACASRDIYPAFVDALREETGIDVELDRTGTVYVGFTEDDERELRRRYEWQTEQSLAVEWRSGEELQRLEPNLSGAVCCALLFPNDFQVENRRLIAALLRANEQLGVRLVSNCEVRSLGVENDRVRGLETALGNISASVVVIAAGAWSATIVNVEPRIRVEPVRGQMLCFRPTFELPRHVIFSARGYLVPRRDGRLLAGSTDERVGFEKCITAEGISAIRSMAEEIVPDLRDLALADSWAGFRPCAEDSLPVLGPSQDVNGLFIATGHYRNGILLAPITGKLISQAIVDGANSPLLAPFLPTRFRSIAASV